MAGEYDKSKYTRMERFKNFWYYTKFYIIFSIVFVLFLVIQIRKIYMQPDTGFYTVFFNTIFTQLDDGKSYMNDFAAENGIKGEMVTQVHLGFDITQEVDVQEYTVIQQLGAYVANGDLDVAIADDVAFDFIAYWDCLADLRELLPEETLEKLKPYLYYVDWVILEERAETSYGTEEYNTPLPDPTKPELMQEPVPVGIYLKDIANDKFYEEIDISGGNGVMGVFVSTRRAEKVLKFLDYIQLP